MPFSKQTLEFLAENQMRDSKQWYTEHKEDYKRLVIEPFNRLLDDLRPVFGELDERLDCGRWRISRLYRDARYNQGRSIFRDDVWCSVSRVGQDGSSSNGLYFDFSPRGFEFGCGYYMMPRETMDTLREMILSGDRCFLAALESCEGQSLFELRGQSYKRNHYPDQPERLSRWLNRKDIYFSHQSCDFELFYSDELSAFVADGFRSMAEVWRLLVRIEEQTSRTKWENSLPE